MPIYEVNLKAIVTDAFRVIADSEQEAIERAEIIFRNDNAAKISVKSFGVSPYDEVRKDESSLYAPNLYPSA